ncbi:uncharacterized protein BcabD6B2_49920 [Babesia caballi]|uniref:Transmembrane protein, putative n=1 Tax=Babesia caballi TaxID=5871 RepID=A0AAV4LZ97_BABCB|nr:transmembrane protein, putative [Babesia caballi]
MRKRKGLKNYVYPFEAITADMDSPGTSPSIRHTSALGRPQGITRVHIDRPVVSSQREENLELSLTDDPSQRRFEEGAHTQRRVTFRSPIESARSMECGEKMNSNEAAEVSACNGEEVTGVEKLDTENHSSTCVQENIINEQLEVDENVDNQEVQCSSEDLVDRGPVNDILVSSVEADADRMDPDCISVEVVEAPIKDSEIEKVTLEETGAEETKEVVGETVNVDEGMLKYESDLISEVLSTKVASPCGNVTDGPKGLGEQPLSGLQLNSSDDVTPEKQGIDSLQQQQTNVERDEDENNVHSESTKCGVIQCTLELGDEGSLAIYEKLKSDYLHTVGDNYAENVRVSRIDSASDYRTAIDDQELLYDHIDGAFVIDMSPNNEFPDSQLDALTSAFHETVKYMKCREASRYHKHEVLRCSKMTCALAILMFVGFVHTGIVLSNNLEVWLPSVFPSLVSEANAAANSVAKNAEFYTFIPMAVLTICNLALFGTGYIYYKVMKCTAIFVALFTVTLCCHLLGLYTFYKSTDSIVTTLKMAISVQQNICIHNVCAENFITLLYQIVLIGVNFWLVINQLVAPSFLSYMVRRDVTRIAVTAFDRCNVAVPNDTIKSDRHGTITAKGYAVRIEHKTGLPLFWRILCRLTGNRLMQTEPTGVYQFVGELNRNLKPHGYGMWQSSTPYGELLIGYWEHGLPLGAFRSRELATGGNFSNMLLGWVKCNMGGGLTMGAASVECCISDANFAAYPIVMKYRAEIFDEDNITQGLIKHVATPASRTSEEAVFLPSSDQVVLRLYKVASRFIGYDFTGSDAYVRDIVMRGSATRKLKNLLCDVLLQKPGTRRTSDVLDCMFKVLERNVPSFVSHEGAEITASMDSDSKLHVDGFVPFDVTFDNEMSPIASQRHSKVTIRVDDNWTGARRGSSRSTLLRKTMEQAMVINGWKKRGFYKKPEVCVFIHGLDGFSDRYIQNVAQLFTFWNYPQYIKPVTFGWPLFSTVDQDHPERCSDTIMGCKDALETFLRGILKNGVTDVHFVVDTTGVAMFLEAFAMMTHVTNPSCIFRSVGSHQKADADQINLLTVTLMFPDYKLERFLTVLYRPLRAHCNIITIFGEQSPKSKFWNLFSCSKGKMANNIKGVYLDRGHELLYDTLEYKTDVDEQPTLGSIMLPSLKECNLEGGSEEPENRTNAWLDVDCIDVTWLPSVSGYGRSSSWHLFREVAEDLREVIVGRKRAKDRAATLDRAGGNVWVYNANRTDHLIMLSQPVDLSL